MSDIVLEKEKLRNIVAYVLHSEKGRHINRRVCGAAHDLMPRVVAWNCASVFVPQNHQLGLDQKLEPPILL